VATAVSERAVELSNVKACEWFNCHCFVDAPVCKPIECPWHCQSFQQKAVHIHMDHAADLRLGTIGNDMQDSTCDFAATSFAGSIDKLH